MGLTGAAVVPRFGTDGWRATIADEYTFSNVRLVTQAIADFAKANWTFERGIVVGYDTRFGSDRFAKTVCEVLAANGIPALISSDSDSDTGRRLQYFPGVRRRRSDRHRQPQPAVRQWRQSPKSHGRRRVTG